MSIAHRLEDEGDVRRLAPRGHQIEPAIGKERRRAPLVGEDQRAVGILSWQIAATFGCT
jgi:hypothetical protein